MKIPKTLLKKLAQLNDSKLPKEDNLEIADFACSDAVLSQQVLLSEDLLSKIFEHLSLLEPSGFTDAEIARSEPEMFIHRGHLMRCKLCLLLGAVRSDNALYSKRP